MALLRHLLAPSTDATVRVHGVAARSAIGQVRASGTSEARVREVGAQAQLGAVAGHGRRHLTWEELATLAEAA
jgi:hypothetical protein